MTKVNPMMNTGLILWLSPIKGCIESRQGSAQLRTNKFNPRASQYWVQVFSVFFSFYFSNVLKAKVFLEIFQNIPCIIFFNEYIPCIINNRIHTMCGHSSVGTEVAKLVIRTNIQTLVVTM